MMSGNWRLDETDNHKRYFSLSPDTRCSVLSNLGKDIYIYFIEIEPDNVIAKNLPITNEEACVKIGDAFIEKYARSSFGYLDVGGLLEEEFMVKLTDWYERDFRLEMELVFDGSVYYFKVGSAI